MEDFRTRLEDTAVLLVDGATGTNYFNAGLETGHPPELWVEENPEAVLALHDAFLEAGADIILTNSFGGTANRLKLHQAENRVAALNSRAARLACQARDRHCEDHGRSGPSKQKYVAGSIGPTGELFQPLGMLSHAMAVDAFAEQANALAEGGVDLLWIETMSSIEEIDAALEAGLATGLPVVATMTFDTAGKSMMGVTPAAFASHASQRGISAVGANCGIGPAELIHSMLGMLEDSSIPLVAKGNCGIPEYLDGKIHYHGTPELMASYALIARDAGIRMIGGCCGTTPQHIAAMRQALDTTPPQPGVDAARLEASLGKPWPDLNPDAASASAASGATDRQRRGRRRR